MPEGSSYKDDFQRPDTGSGAGKLSGATPSIEQAEQVAGALRSLLCAPSSTSSASPISEQIRKEEAKVIDNATRASKPSGGGNGPNADLGTRDDQSLLSSQRRKEDTLREAEAAMSGAVAAIMEGEANAARNDGETTATPVSAQTTSTGNETSIESSRTGSPAAHQRILSLPHPMLSVPTPFAQHHGEYRFDPQNLPSAFSYGRAGYDGRFGTAAGKGGGKGSVKGGGYGGSKGGGGKRGSAYNGGYSSAAFRRNYTLPHAGKVLCIEEDWTSSWEKGAKDDQKEAEEKAKEEEREQMRRRRNARREEARAEEEREREQLLKDDDADDGNDDQRQLRSSTGATRDFQRLGRCPAVLRIQRAGDRLSPPGHHVLAASI